MYTTERSRYRVYTKPDCPHCDRAKRALALAFIPYEVEQPEEDARKAFLAKLGGWNTWPVIFALNAAGHPCRFVGGADALEAELAQDAA